MAQTCIDKKGLNIQNDKILYKKQVFFLSFFLTIVPGCYTHDNKKKLTLLASNFLLPTSTNFQYILEHSNDVCWFYKI